MEQVSKALVEGLRALHAFLDMLYASAAGLGAKPQPEVEDRRIGVSIRKKADWIGIYFDEPEVLVFATLKRKVDTEAAHTLGIGSVHPWRDGSGNWWWKRELHLESEAVNFFDRPKNSQRELLNTFLKECLDQAVRVQVFSEETGT